MQVWFVEEIDRDGDREILSPCASEEVAKALVAEKEEANEEFTRQYGVVANYTYEVYPVDVLDSLD